jgi:beta-lactamase regulating signal transducer with metallopeptidase domain/protocatechuate 3,4-dioxygenase beta subunit
MSAVFARYLDDFRQSPFLLDAAVKATVLLAAAMLAAALLRRSSAAVRHRIWCLTFAALVLLPGLSAALPQWRLAVLPNRGTLVGGPLLRSPLAPQAERALTTQTPPPVENDSARQPVPLAEQAGYEGTEQAIDVAPLRNAPSGRIHAPNLASLWLFGALASILPLIAGLARTLLLRRQSLPIRDASWTALVDQLRQRLALSRRVRLYENTSATMPMTWGVLQPVVMLPRHARDWTERLRRVVLLHELAHVKRCDVGFQFLGRAACALYWFHPLAWYALRRLRIERELACDDCVVLAGERATDYAADLLQIARAYRTVPFAAAVAMAQRSNLEHRLRALFDRARSHLPIGTRTARLLLLAVLVLVTTVAAVRLAPRQMAIAEDQSSDVDVVAVHGRVLDPKGEPLAGAKLYLCYPNEDGRQPELLGASGSDGRFELRVDRTKLDTSRSFDPRVGCNITAVAEGFGLEWIELGKPDANGEYTLRLVEDLPIQGRIVDVDGQPVAGAAVRLRQLAVPKDGLDDYIEATRGGAFYAFERTRDTLPGTAEKIAVDREGRFTLRGIGAERMVELGVEGPGIEWSYIKAMTRDTSAVAVGRGAPGTTFSTSLVYGATFGHVPSPSRPIVGTVRDAESGLPIAGVTIRSRALDRSTTHSPKTNPEGRFELLGHPKARLYQLIAVPDGLPYFEGSAQADDTPGLDPITIDIKLARGLEARGRLTFEPDGQPGPGTVEYWPLYPNDRAQKISTRAVGRPMASATIGVDGTYRLPVLPGPGVLAFSAGRFRRALYALAYVGREEIDAFFQDGQDHGDEERLWKESGGPGRAPLTQTNYNRLVLINPPADALLLETDALIETGRVVTGVVSDPDGQPLAGVLVSGLGGQRGFGERQLDGPEFSVAAMNPHRSRELVFRFPGKLWGTVVQVPGDQADPLSVRLDRCGVVVGRLLDAEGMPLGKAQISVSRHQHAATATVESDAAGVFRVDDLIPGLKYDMYLLKPLLRPAPAIQREVSVSSGETKDVGDVHVKPPAGATAALDGVPATSEKRAAENMTRRGDETTTLHGRVLSPDGKPVAEAKVFFWYPKGERSQPELRCRTKADGSFEFGVDKSKPETTVAPDPWSRARIIAAAEGYGFEWVDAATPEADGGYTIRLVRDVPIQGRILTLEGQPVAGAKVRVANSIACPANNGLDEYLESLKTRRPPRNPVRYATTPSGEPNNATTDEQGRFTLAGIGAERYVILSVEGSGIGSARLTVVTREMEPIVRPSLFPGNNPPERVLGATFTQLVQPSRIFRGLVRDRETQKPIAGVTVRMPGSGEAKTDDIGRFELAGATKGPIYFLQALAANTPYFNSSLQIDDPPGLEPVEVVFDLARGAIAKGRVTPAVPGKGGHVEVEYYPLWLNAYTERVGPRLARPCASAVCDEEGRYTIPVLPGLGILTYRLGSYSGQTYPEYMSAWLSQEEIEAFYESAGLEAPAGDTEGFVRVSVGGQVLSSIILTSYNHAVLINPREDETSLTRDVELPLGRTLEVNVVDPDGKPVVGTRVRGVSNALSGADTFDKAGFTVVGLNPRVERQLIIEQREKNLAAYKVLQGEQAGPLTVKLEPCGAVRGRLLDAAGEPLAKQEVHIGRQRFFPGEFVPTTDAEGRFQAEGLVPGLTYAVSARRPGMPGMGTVANDIVLAAGETKNLGDLRLQAPAMMRSPTGFSRKAGDAPPAAPKKLATDGADASPQPEAAVIRGRVLLPDGNPAVGADLYWPQADSPPPRTAKGIRFVKRGASDDRGRFQIALSAADVSASGLALHLVAHKAGFGIDWLNVEAGEVPADIVLHLVEDRPIRGRVTDTEGRPVAGARLVVNGMGASRDGNLDAFLTAWEQDSRDAWRKLDHALHSPLEAIIGAVSDPDGHFELSGIGLERVAGVAMRAPGYADDQLRVVNRQGFDASKYNEITRASLTPYARQEGLFIRLAGPQLDYVAEVEVVVRGRVFTGNDRTPVKGALLEPAGRGDTKPLSVRSDQQGRYELHGLPRNRDVWFQVSPLPGSDLLARTIQRAAVPGEAAVELDVELKHGVTVEGRVFDQATSRGLKGDVRFVPLPGNKFAGQPGFDYRSGAPGDTSDDGRFRLVVIPGPGVLMTHVSSDGPRFGDYKLDRYRQAAFSEVDRQRVLPKEDDDDRYFAQANGSVEFLSRVNAAKVIDGPEGGEPVRCDLPVDSGKTVNLSIEDEEHQPVPNAFVAGLTDMWPATFRIAEAACTIYALGADRPRKVCVLHPERGLAASLTLTGDEQGPVTVRLAPAASIAGRALDASGEPIAGAVVAINYARKNVRELDRFASLEHPPVKTDDDGRFRVTNIVPGERFALDFSQGTVGPGMVYFRANLTDEQRQLKAGQELDLGDAKMKQLRIGG